MSINSDKILTLTKETIENEAKTKTTSKSKSRRKKWSPHPITGTDTFSKKSKGGSTLARASQTFTYSKQNIKKSEKISLLKKKSPKYATSTSTFVHKSTIYGNGYGNLYGTQKKEEHKAHVYTVVKHKKNYTNFTTDLVLVIGILMIMFIFLFYILK